MEINVQWLLGTDYAQPKNFVLITAILLAAIFLRYVLFAWGYHVLVYKKLGDAQPFRRLHQQLKLMQVKREIGFSFLGSIIFALFGTALLILWQNGYTRIYTTLSAADWLFIPLSTVAALLIHETYYYWLHRAMHHPKVLHRFHHIHHNSVFTSSFTSFSFHPAEAILQAIFLPLLVLVLPMHVLVLVTLLVFMSISAVINHAGVEVFPAAAARSPFWKWFIGATHHDVHHLKFRCNYGLYFTFWDVWMKTEDPGFSSRFADHTVKVK